MTPMTTNAFPNVNKSTSFFTSSVCAPQQSNAKMAFDTDEINFGDKVCTWLINKLDTFVNFIVLPKFFTSRKSPRDDFASRETISHIKPRGGTLK